MKNINLGIDKNTAIAAGISVVFLLLMVFVGMQILTVEQPETGEPKKLRVQASAKTYTRNIPLEFANQPEPTPEEFLQEEPSPTPTPEPLFVINTPVPEITEEPTPSVPAPEPTDDQLLASGASPTPTPVQQLPDAGNFGNLLILLAVSSFIVFIAFIL